ncbi:FecR family protein [Reichenbachiella ulvae]|uniref:FecR domain-containing protein n=1 Tax=Reichenbachiella ulvae TaxID=2980104 RepID=A0ABT3CRJ8_9BACT|nr:FecR domain-containing protein [Reichenbachiella ulvae]MCV9386336.1 FecR domain-containing protein [Reichenbachiella ulvae]
MSDKNGHIVNDEMLYRYFAKELSEIEEALVDDWKIISEENQRQFDEAHVFYLDMKALASIEKFENDVEDEKSWEKFKIKKEFKPKTPSTQEPQQEESISKLRLPYFNIAAAIGVLIIISWVLFGPSLSDDEYRITSNNSQDEVELKDGSHVTLNSHSEITYLSSFDEKERRVRLKGEAFFKVSKNPEKPFIVDLGSATVKVLGTAFNVNSVDPNEITVSVEEGKVSFMSASEEKILTAGQSAKLNTQTAQFESISEISNEANFWRTKSLIFDNNRLSEVIADLENLYDISIELDNPQLSDCTLTVSFENEKLENILEVVSTTLNLEVTLIDETYHLSGNGCQ